MDLTIGLLVLVITFISFHVYKSKKNGSVHIPGPKGYPIVGNAFDVDLKQLHLKLFEWQKLHGDIFKIKLFSQNMVIVNSSKILRELFAKEPNATLSSARPDTFTRKYLLNGVDVVFSSLDKEWTKRRKLMHRLLNAYGEGLKHIEGEITNKLSGLRKELSDLEQKSCNPRDMLEDFVLSVLEILLVGKYQDRHSEFHKFLAEIDETGAALANPGVDTLYNNIPFLRFVPLSTTKELNKFLELRNNLLPFLDKQSGNSTVGIYPSMKKLLKGKETGDDNDTWLDEVTMESMLLNMIGAGFLTTRGALLSLIRILMSSPNVQVKLQQEVDRVVGHDRSPSLSDRSQMPYCEAVILETLRFTSHIPSSILHSTSDDLVVAGYTVPKDTAILTNLWAMHHNEKEWKDPFTFNPERFLDKDGMMLPADNEVRKQFVAFGNGKRSCIGEVFAKSRMFLFVSTLMQLSSVLPPDGKIPPMLDPRDMQAGIVMHPHDYMCRFVKRK